MIFSTYYWIAIASSLVALLYGVLAARTVLSAQTGNVAMRSIASAIQEGAKAYLNRQYRTIAVVGVVIGVIIGFGLGMHVAIGYVIGAVLSALAGYIGMMVSVRANVRTAQAARTSLNAALHIAFRSGAVTGLLVVGLALLGVSAYYGLTRDYFEALDPALEGLVAMGFGASLISIFARLGGGIFTKGADVGADLVGKIEAGIPEDDPRNPAVIADNVGDNVGDCAGMAADLFETYVVTIVATMLLGSIFFDSDDAVQPLILTLPLLMGGSCIIASVIGTFFVRLAPPRSSAPVGGSRTIASVIGTFFVRLSASRSIIGALYRGFFVTAGISAILIGVVIHTMFGFDFVFYAGGHSFTALDLYVCALCGLAVTAAILWITEYYTGIGHRPVSRIADSCSTGHATNIIQGLAISMESTALPVLVICAGIIVSHLLAGLFGIAIAVTAMLAVAGIIIALDAYGPVTDNAGGIAEMASMSADVRKVTDALDAVGNTTKAVTKGYAIGSAALAALVLFAVYTYDVRRYFPDVELDFTLLNPYVVVGLFIGGLLPYLFGALSMTAVGHAAQAVVVEVRRQFREIKGIMSGKQKPEYTKAIDLLTKSAIRQMILPSLLPVLSPIVLYAVVYAIAGMGAAFSAVGAMLLGTITTGLFVAISMTSGGGAWDNAKKQIEDGYLGGKGSDAHKAAITGDTVGDPYKDTVGPAINPMIKVVNIIALLLLIFMHHFMLPS